MHAEGRKDAPLLAVLVSKPSEGMENWMKKVMYENGKIPQEDVRFVYMLEEEPKGSNGKPTTDQLRGYFDGFKRAVVESSPKVVLCFGSDILYYLTGIREGIQDSRGYVIRQNLFRSFEWKIREQIGIYKTSNKTKGINKGDPKWGFVSHSFPGLLGGNFKGVVIPTFTLDHIRTMGFAVAPAFIVDVQRVERAINNKLVMIDENLVYYSDFHHIQKKEEKPISVMSLAQVKWHNDIIAIDIETAGKDNEVIERVSISDGYVTASVPWDINAIDLLNKVFSFDSCLFALHNSSFDIPRLREHGIKISQHVLDHQIFDTMFGAVILQPDLLKGLGPAASIYLDAEPWKWTTLSASDPIYYSAKDAFMTAWLARQEIKIMKNMGLWNLTMGVGDHPGPGVMATLPVLTEMSRKGIRTNREFAIWWVKKLERRQLRLLKLWNKMFPGINPGSPKQLAKLLYTDWKLPIQKTKKETITTDELALIKLRYYITSDYAVVHDNNIWKKDKRCTPRVFDLMLKLRDVNKTISTYVQPVSIASEGRIYPSYLPASKNSESGDSGEGMTSKGNTATGRLATYNPNIGNQPKKKVRKLYVPDTENDCFIQGDWKSAELCVFAHSSGDERLKTDLARDLHKENAKRFGIERDIAKNVNYARQYLAGPGKVNEMVLKQAHIYVPVDECRRIMNGLAEYYYKDTAFKQHLISLCNSKKYIQNPFGRTRMFHDNEAPAAVNFWAQSIVGDCLWCRLKEVSDMAKSFGGRIITTVYDSILIQVPKNVVIEAAKELKRIMEQPFNIVAEGFYLPVEIELGDPGASWGELKKYANLSLQM